MKRGAIIFGQIKKYFVMIIKGRLHYAISQGLNCGKECYVSGGVSFGSEPYLITLHDNVRISGGVSFVTHDGSVHTILKNNLYKDKKIHRYGKIEIGENTFIGAHAIIMPNVYLGKNCIVGAGAVVTHSFPDDSIIAGIPAKIIGNTWEYAKRIVSAMPDDWDNDSYLKDTAEYLKKTVPAPPRI